MTSGEACSVSKLLVSGLQAYCSEDNCLASCLCYVGRFLYSILDLSIKILNFARIIYKTAIDIINKKLLSK